MKNICIRVDIDTHNGLKKGIPKILDILKKYSISATFYCVMGSDTMGQHIKRFKNPEYWKRIFKINPIKFIKNYNIKSFFYGTILKGPQVVEGNEKILNEIINKGHQLGIHGYNHCEWADNIYSASSEWIREDIEKAYLKFHEILKFYPETFAAPNWRSNEKVFKVEEEFNFKFVSDMRGYSPFYPDVNCKKFKILQIPATLPCFHEVRQNGLNEKQIINRIIKNINENEYGIFTIHDWYEGCICSEMLDSFLGECIIKGLSFDTLDNIYAKQKDIAVYSDIMYKKVNGGIGEVTHQK